jgi:hypothetical protein
MAKKGLTISGLVIGVLLAVGGFAGMPIINSALLEPEMAGAMTSLRDEGSIEVKWLAYEDYTHDLLIDGLLEVNETLGGEENVAKFVNSPGSANYLWNVLNATAYVVGWDMALDLFFHDPNFSSTSMSGLPGLNESAPYFYAPPYPFNVTITTYSNATMWALTNMTDYLPSIFDDSFAGTPQLLIALQDGVSDYLGSLQTDSSNLAPYMGAYGATADQLAAFYLYIWEVLIPLTIDTVDDLIAYQFSSLLGFTVPICNSATALNYIKLQWGTKILFPTGLVQLDDLAEGYEVGIMSWGSFQEILDVYDEDNEFSLTNDKGIELWLNASRDDSEAAKTALMAGLGITQTTLDSIISWYLAEDEFEIFLKLNAQDALADDDIWVPLNDDFYLYLLLFQWERMAISEDPVELEGVTGLEVNLPEEDWLTNTTLVNLWDDDFDYALTTEAGMAIWLEAAKGNEDAIADLEENVPLTVSQITAIGEWVLYMRDVVLPKIAEDNGDIAPAVGWLLRTLQDYGTYIGIAGIVVLAGFGFLLKKK